MPMFVVHMFCPHVLHDAVWEYVRISVCRYTRALGRVGKLREGKEGGKEGI